jgi:hypothetical protein
MLELKIDNDWFEESGRLMFRPMGLARSRTVRLIDRYQPDRDSSDVVHGIGHVHSAIIPD